MSCSAAFFAHRRLLIATKHGKEQVIAPLMEAAFSIQSIPPPEYDTDVFGTFSGEVERQLDPISTVREKARRAAAAFNADLVIASEGSFGPHPSLFFVPADEEWLLLYDARNQVEIIAKEVSTDTNFIGRRIASEQELHHFAAQTRFPSHRLIVRNAERATDFLQKGIGTWEELSNAFHACHQQQGGVYVETDMRAMYNPTRQAVIRSCTEKLIERMNSCCPTCRIPGYGIINALPGLPCSLCGSPTRSTRAYVYGCSACGHRQEAAPAQGKLLEDPMYCDYCNP
jgi:hypothetical protein